MLRDREGRHDRLALALVAIACLAAGLLTRGWEVPYLVVLATATGLAAVVAVVGRVAWGGRVAIAWTVLVALTGLVGWRAWRDGQVAVGVPTDLGAELERRIARIAPELEKVARQLATTPIPDEPGRRHLAVERVLPTPADGEAAGVVIEHGRPMAWAGPVRAALEDFVGRSGVVQTPFYTVLWVRDTVGARTAIAMRTLAAVAPATALSRPLAAVLARDLGLSDVRVSSAPNDGMPLSVGGRPVAWFAPVAAAGAGVDANRDALWRAAVLGLVAVILLLVAAGAWPVDDRRWPRLAAVLIMIGVLAVAPLSRLSNLAPVFSALRYFSPVGGAFTASPGALTAFGGLCVLALLLLERTRWPRPPLALGGAVAIAALAVGPSWLTTLAAGVSLPQRGAGAGHWVAWALALFLATLPLVLVPAWLLARSAPGGRPRLARLASSLAAVGGLAAPMVWRVELRTFPGWYALAWVGVVALLLLARHRRALLLHAGIVVASATLTVLWSTVTRQRLELAERDVEGLALADEETQALLERLYARATRAPIGTSRAALLKLYTGTDLAAAGNPAELALWERDRIAEGPTAELVVAQLQRRIEGERRVVEEAATGGAPVLREFASRQGVHLVLAAPLDSTRLLSAVVAPRSQLIADDPFAALLGLDVPTVVEPPYRLTLGGTGGAAASTTPTWQRRDDELHGDWLVDSALGNLHAHAEVELRSLDLLAARAVLLLLVDLLALGLLRGLVGVGDRALRRWFRRRAGRWWGSYRARLTLTLFGAFVIPSIAFGVWTLDRLEAEDRTSRALLVQETLRAVRLQSPAGLAVEAERLQTPLLWYDGGVLTATADPLHLELAPLGRLLDPVAAEEVVFGREATANRRISLGAVPTLIGYRTIGAGSVLAAPARRTELTLERQRADVIALLLVALALGAVVAWALSGFAAVAFAEPIGALRRAADDVARGARDLPALAVIPATEFGPVFRRFRAMAVELGDSRDALDASRRRTEAVLRDVASGVVALDRDGRVVLANPLAERILGRPLSPGTPIGQVVDGEVGERVAAFASATTDEDAFDLPHRGRQVRARLTRLSRGDGGVILTLDDVTDLARAQRVFAWAEMARQVAHEIKNPLTPIRLGVQHLRRAHADGRADFGRILAQNVDRVLEEIDRLDEIARSFSKFGVRPGELPPPPVIPLAGIVHDVVRLERLGDSAVSWEVEVDEALQVRARDGELREVLLNLLENARLAQARRVVVRARAAKDVVILTVTDDGEGVPEELLARVFEPRFSTRTSGSGLGLAISKRLVESWGGRIQLERAATRGTVVTVTMESPLP